MDDESVKRSFYLGLDLGEMRDYSALAVIERAEVRGHDPTLELRTLKRWPHKSGYPVVVADVTKSLMSPFFQVQTSHWNGAVSIDFAPRILIIDRAGVGLPIVQLFEAALPDDVELLACYVHSGKTVSEPQAGFINLPKRDLVYSAVAAFQTRKLAIAENVTHGAALKDELRNFRRHISESGRDSYEASRGHDDLVFALSLATWAASSREHHDWSVATGEVAAAFSFR